MWGAGLPKQKGERIAGRSAPKIAGGPDQGPLGPIMRPLDAPRGAEDRGAARRRRVRPPKQNAREGSGSVWGAAPLGACIPNWSVRWGRRVAESDKQTSCVNPCTPPTLPAPQRVGGGAKESRDGSPRAPLSRPWCGSGAEMRGGGLPEGVTSTWSPLEPAPSRFNGPCAPGAAPMSATIHAPSLALASPGLGRNFVSLRSDHRTDRNQPEAAARGLPGWRSAPTWR